MSDARRCPQCGSDDLGTTMIGTFSGMESNETRCHACGWKMPTLELRFQHAAANDPFVHAAMIRHLRHGVPLEDALKQCVVEMSESRSTMLQKLVQQAEQAEEANPSVVIWRSRTRYGRSSRADNTSCSLIYGESTQRPQGGTVYDAHMRWRYMG